MKHTLYILIAFVMINACTKDLDKGGDLASGDSVFVRFSVTVKGISLVKTKAGVAVEESVPANIWVLQFDGTDNGSKLTKAEYISTISDINNLGVHLNIGTNQRILFVANTFDDALFNGTNAPINSYTYSDFLTETISYTSESSVFKGTTTKYLILYGYYTGTIPNGSASVVLYHINAKISMSYTSVESMDIFNPGIVKIKSVQLRSVPASSPYYMTPSNTVNTNPSSVVNYTTITTGSNSGTGMGEAYSISDYSGNVTFYMPENISGTVNDVTSEELKGEYAPANATFIEFKGELFRDGSFVSNVVYKLYLGKNITTDYNINSNTHYSISIRFLGLDMNDTRLITSKTDNWIDGTW